MVLLCLSVVDDEDDDDDDDEDIVGLVALSSLGNGWLPLLYFPGSISMISSSVVLP